MLPFFRQLLTMRNSGGLEHSEHVTRLCLLMGERIGLSPEDMASLEFGAAVHDIGKLAIDDSILNKPGKLTRNELLAMRQHPTEGAQLLTLLDGRIPPDVIKMVQDHHEDFDGLGYPGGKRGLAIHWGGRIIHIPDAFCAMTTDARVYRAIKTKNQAIDDLLNQASRYDPEYLKVFLEVVDE